jgi:hypothetical protein
MARGQGEIGAQIINLDAPRAVRGRPELDAPSRPGDDKCEDAQREETQREEAQREEAKEGGGHAGAWGSRLLDFYYNISLTMPSRHRDLSTVLLYLRLVLRAFSAFAVVAAAPR